MTGKFGRNVGTGRFAQLALVAVMALVFGMAGLVADANAANVTYHMRGLSAQSVGVDGTTNVVAENGVTYEPIVGTPWRAIASTTPSTNTLRNRFRESANWSGTEQFLRVYSPLYAPGMNIGAGATCSFDIYSATASVYAELYEYNDTTGIVGSVKGTTNTLTIASVPSHNILTFDNVSFTVATGNRLVVYYYLNGNGADPRPIFGAASYNSGTPAGDLYFVVDETAACSDTNGSAITLTSPINAATVSGSVNLAASLNNAATAEYSIAGGAWTSIATPWNTLTSHPGSSTAAVNSVTVDVRAVEDECGGFVTDSITVTVDNTCSESTASSISFNGTTTAAGNFSGASLVSPVDLTGLEYRITETSGGGAGAVSVLEDFSTTDITNTTTSSATTSYTPPVGSNRLVVLMVQIHTNNTTATTVSMTYGDGAGGGAEITATPVVNTDSAQRRQIWIATLSEAQLASSPGNVVTVTTDNAGSGYILHIATYAGVDQTAPVTDTGNIYSGTTTVNNYNWGTALNVNAGGYGVVGSVASQTLTSLGANETYDEYGQTTVGSAYAGISDKAFTSAGTTLPNLVSSANAYSGVAGITLNPAAGGPVETELLAWNLDPQEATGLLTNGNTYTLYARGTDPECGGTYYVGGTSEPGTGQDFTWADCTETATLTLQSITNPISGDVTVTATGTATGIQVGISPSPTNTSPWTYVPAADDNTSVVSFYATGTGSCGTLTRSQLNVATNTMAAPTVTAFSVPATVVDTAAPLDVPVSAFTASDNLAVTGYMITESSVAPSAGAAGWSASAPTSYTVSSWNTYTLYAWTKDAAGNVSLSASATTTVENCVEAGSVTVSISPDPGAGDITGNVVVTASPANGASNGQVRWRENGGAWSAWAASGSTYNVANKSTGTVDFEAMADGSCGAGSPVYSATLNRTYETRVPALEPVDATAAQNGLTGIVVHFIYCNDLNGSGTYKVEWKLNSSGTWLPADAIIAVDGGANDNDAVYNQDVMVLISGLASGGLYDVRMTFIDNSDGLTGINPFEYNQAVQLVAWTDNPMLHNSNRFVGTSKHGGNWGTDTGYGGGIMCSTCHEKAPANGNIKRVKAAISFPDGSAMPGGGTSAAISLLSVEDTTSDLGDDSLAPRSSSSSVCEACHTYDATQANGVKQHAANQQVAANHFDKTDCIKCHQHNAGFKADCTSCHGHPPVVSGELTATLSPANSTGSATAGKHQLHAIDKAYDCNVCHNGWQGSAEMPNNGNLNIGFNIVLGSTSDSTGTYNGRSTGSYTAAVGTTTTTTNNSLTCATIYCHGSAAPAWSDAGTAVCGSCHGDANGMPAATAGDGDLSGSNTGSKVGKHASHVTNQGFACSVCHNGAGTGSALHVDGKNDIVFDTTLAGVTASYAAGSSTCSNLSCHSTAVWDTASTGGCDFCHGYPPNGTGGSTNHFSRTGLGSTDANFYSAHNTCSTCHGVAGNIAPPSVATARAGYVDLAASGGNAYIEAWHNDGKVQLNGYNAATGNGADDKNAGYDGTGGCAKACHAASVKLTSLGTNTVELREFGGGDCNGCHDSGTGGATIVTATSGHVDADGAGGTYTAGTCTDCHPGGTRGAMHAKNGDANVVAVPNYVTIGINYGHTVDTGVQGFVLGGDATTGTTEAQICWNCHDLRGISEWGANTKATTGSSPYNYGNLTSSNWTTATWSSSRTQFAYKTGAIQSTHTANPSVTDTNLAGANYSKTEAPNAAADIRCSNCHDVHNLNNATGDTLSGTPYLRGNWMGNPYEEDGAPRASYANTTYFPNVSNWGAVPRGSNTQRRIGGYWIDQNNAVPMTATTTTNGTAAVNPTGAWTVDQFGGLCALCHGGGNSSWTTTEVDNIDQKTGEALWMGTNGHANSVKGGTGSGSANSYNVFDARLGVTAYGHNPRQHFAGMTDPGDNGNFGFRSVDGLGYAPTLPQGEPRMMNTDNWVVDETGATKENQYHKFSCSKCHNPHASRLPKLMITNCLDTVHNTWDNQFQLNPSTGNNLNREVAQWTSAQNCHRYSESNNTTTSSPEYRASRTASPAGAGFGWNKVTPWKQTTSTP